MPADRWRRSEHRDILGDRLQALRQQFPDERQIAVGCSVSVTVSVPSTTLSRRGVIVTATEAWLAGIVAPEPMAV